MQLEYRQYMEDARQAVAEAYSKNVRQQLVVMATGTGKTVLFSLLIKDLKKELPAGKVLVFAHREELVNQAIETIKWLNPELKVGKEMASDYADDNCDVVVSCVASIGRNGSTRLARFGSFSMVVCDEAHHSIAQSYLNVFDTTEVLRSDNRALLIGFTATPKRKNRVRSKKNEVLLTDEDLISLRSVYEKITFSYPIRQAIKDGWLVPLRGYRVSSDVNLNNIKTTAGDFQQDELQDTVNIETRNQLALDSWLKYGENRQTVIFTTGINHAQDMAKVFRDAGVKAEAVWGTDPNRATKLHNHKNKHTTVLINVDVLTEGYDDWRVSCIVDAAPTQSSTKYTQRVGRGTRLQEGSGNLLKALAAGYALEKRDCIVIDVVDNYAKNSLVTLPSLVGLSPNFNLHGGSATKAAEEIEKLQEKFPGVSFTHLEDLDKVQAYVESIDLFADPAVEEVGDLSNLMWMPLQDGSYVLSIPESKYVQSIGYKAYQHEKWYIKPNELGEYEVWIKDRNNNKQVGEYSTLEKAFSESDDAVRRFRTDRIKPLQRIAEWHNYPATPQAKQYLSRLSKNKPMPYCLCSTPTGDGKECELCHKETGITAGQVSLAINKLKAN